MLPKKDKEYIVFDNRMIQASINTFNIGGYWSMRMDMLQLLAKLNKDYLCRYETVTYKHMTETVIIFMWKEYLTDNDAQGEILRIIEKKRYGG